MPCDSVQTTTVEFGKNTDRKLLIQALQAVNVGRYDLSEDCELTLYGPSRYREQEVKREYSKQVVVAQAQKFGWKVAPLEEGRKEQRHVRV